MPALSEKQRPEQIFRPPLLYGFEFPAYLTVQRYRKVMIWARVQAALGLKVVAEVSLVTPFCAVQTTASA